MSVADAIRAFAGRVELLAPAGRWDALEAALEAGADAVYIGLKRLNMRTHRSDFNFTDGQLADAVALAHGLGKRIYVTLNALLCQQELGAAKRALVWLAELGADAVIVQDLATLNLAAKLSLDVPLHASTMMNVHHPEHARALKDLGIRRIIISRDIDVAAAGQIGRLADIEVEYFVHGDMCVSQSGQCSMSGVLFGKSANRGECMKPCRWEYELVRLDDGQKEGHFAEGHLLAIKDLCLLRHVPDLIQAGIYALKIEGRMRDAPYLRHLVAIYREAIDAYYDCPPTFALKVAAIEETYRQKIRELSTLTTLGGASHRGMFDVSGRREPLFLTNGYAETPIDEEPEERNDIQACGDFPPHAVELAVCVSNCKAGDAAIRAGADRIYLSAEVSQFDGQPWSMEAIFEVIENASVSGVKVGLRTPRITTQREWAETRWVLEKLADRHLDHILVHHLGTFRLAREVCPHAGVIADYGFNLINSEAIEVLGRLGCVAATFSNEGGLADLAAVAESTPLPLEILAHGPVAGMLLDHCVIALNASPLGRKDVCRGPCRHVAFGLKDRAGQVRPIIADQHCRNHLLTACDLAIFPRLEEFLFPAVGSIRIEGQLYSSDLVETVTRAYRRRLDAGGFYHGLSNRGAEAWDELCCKSPRPLSFGPYGRSIADSRSARQLMQELAR